ncbi:MAG: hypothetical protein ACLTON_01260 [Christensenellales bacterium]|jgi:hypothetical protein|nr:unknown [Clostridium sp. CAG:465]
MEDNYKKAYKEVVEILKFVSKENVDKIPKEMLDMFEEEQDKEYNFKVDTTKSFEEQLLLEETKAIFSNIFRDYWANDYQRKVIIEKENMDRIKWEEEKYDPKDLFKNNQKNFNKQNNNDKVDVNLTVIKKENSFKKLIDKIFKSLKKKFLT